MRTIQFRCGKCNRLLLKYEIGMDKFIYRAPDLEHKQIGKEMFVKCTKETCRTVNQMLPFGLKVVDLVEH